MPHDPHRPNPHPAARRANEPGRDSQSLGLPGKKTQWVLVNMRDKGLVELIGEGRFSRWCLDGQAPNNVADLVAQHEQSAVARYLSGAL